MIQDSPARTPVEGIPCNDMAQHAHQWKAVYVAAYVMIWPSTQTSGRQPMFRYGPALTPVEGSLHMLRDGPARTLVQGSLWYDIAQHAHQWKASYVTIWPSTHTSGSSLCYDMAQHACQWKAAYVTIWPSMHTSGGSLCYDRTQHVHQWKAA